MLTRLITKRNKICSENRNKFILKKRNANNVRGSVVCSEFEYPIRTRETLPVWYVVMTTIQSNREPSYPYNNKGRREFFTSPIKYSSQVST